MVRIGFLALIYSAGAGATEESVDSFGVSVGRAFLTADMTTAELSFRHRRWEFGGTIFGFGDTDKGEQDRLAYGASITRLIRPNWNWCRGSFYGRVGVAYIEDSPLVGHFNFRTGIGIDFDAFALELLHYSSASLTPLNTGINVLQFRVPF